MTDRIKLDYNRLLENIAQKLDISPTKYKMAVERYEAVGKWLNDGLSTQNASPSIYPQGSFRLGTVVRPWRENKESDYDIDLVCQLPAERDDYEPQIIKQAVGNRIKENGTYLRMLDKEGKRCWTLNYAENDGVGFHLDILPATNEDADFVGNLQRIGVQSFLAERAIAITNKDESEYSYCSSNPAGYAEWFDSIRQPAFELVSRNQKEMIFESSESVYASVEEVPDALVKTPLQRAIQILKRHRDIRFAGHKWDSVKPISMIITTLSARFYNNESDLYTTLQNIIEQLRIQAQLLEPGFIFESAEYNLPFMKRVNGGWYIPNPVNPDENFADRWHEDGDIRARAFFEWVTWVYEDLVNVFNGKDIRQVGNSLENVFGGKLIEAASKGIFITGAPSIRTENHQKRHHVEIKNPPKPWGKINQ